MLLNLFESLILIHGEWSDYISKSMAASSGLYDIHSDNWIDVKFLIFKISCYLK